jgi:hypothetical protein
VLRFIIFNPAKTLRFFIPLFLFDPVVGLPVGPFNILKKGENAFIPSYVF